MDQIYVQKLPSPEDQPSPLKVIGAICFFLLSHLILSPAYAFFIIMLLFGGMSQIQSDQADYGTALFAIVMGMAPLILCSRAFLGFVRKYLSKQVHYATYKWISIVWICLLGLYAFVAVVPNNPIATTVSKVQSTKRYENQWEETFRHLPYIQEETPFYVATGTAVTVSLYHTPTGVYVQYEDTLDTLAVHQLKELNSGEIRQSGNSIVLSETVYDVSYLLRNALPLGGQVAIHTTSHGGAMIVQVEEAYYHCDNNSVVLNPDTQSNSMSGFGTASYVHIVTGNLYDDVPINPLDDDSVIYGHLPYYDLFQSVEFDFPWIGYEIIDSILPTPPESRLTGKASDIDGENFLSAGTGSLSETYLRGNDPLYTTTEHVFEKRGEEVMYYYFLLHDGERYVRASDYMTITRAQYEVGQW